MHCDNKYRPIGLTEPLSKITKRDVAYNQARCAKKLQTAIWQKLLGGKIYNQRNLLENIDADHSYLTESLKSKKLNESSCARHYWNEYFTHCGFSGLTRRSDDEHDANKMLNYAYAVLGAICHRSIVSHGMSPLFGVQHQARFHNHPFVYDLIEPLRSFVDYQLYTYLTSRNGEKPELKEWALFSQGCWDNIEVIRDKSRFKLIDAVDMYVNSLANCFQTKDVESVWLPELQVL